MLTPMRRLRRIDNGSPSRFVPQTKVGRLSAMNMSASTGFTATAPILGIKKEAVSSFIPTTPGMSRYWGSDEEIRVAKRVPGSPCGSPGLPQRQSGANGTFRPIAVRIVMSVMGS